MKAVKDTIKCMNDYGRKRIPFVFLADFEMQVPKVFRLDELERNNIRISFPGFSNSQNSNEPIEFVFQKQPIEFGRYKKAFEIVKSAINRGDTFLLNLTFPTKLNTNLTPDKIFDHSRAKYKLKFKDRFVFFSPESFIKINGNRISSYPMKGTMDASSENAEKKLIEDTKEISEHNTIVDLIRNDLSMVAKNVKVTRFRYMEKIKTHEKELLQTSSEITGELPVNWNEMTGEIIFKLLPAGSVSGAPKKKTVEIIKAAEGCDRGYFTGIAGYFNGESLDSAVMIRYIEKQNDNLIFRSGGGITYFSECEDEYKELIDKVYLPIYRVANLSKVGNPGNPTFEVIKTRNRQLQNIEYHNDRFNRTRYELFGTRKQLKLEEIIKIPFDLDDSVYKCRIIYSRNIEKIEFEPYHQKRVGSLKLVEHNEINYSFKFFDRTKINELYKQRNNCDDILIIKNGFVTDTSFANIVFWDGSMWVTPSTPLLPGTKRRKLIKENKIQEKEIKASDLQSFEKARIINAMIDLEESADIKKII